MFYDIHSQVDGYSELLKVEETVVGYASFNSLDKDSELLVAQESHGFPRVRFV